MEDVIDSFQGPHRWLSNFWPANVLLDGHLYPSVENAYQAAKMHPSQRAAFRTCTAGQAKRLGRQGDIRHDWDLVKVSTMRELLNQKFSVGSPLAAKLVATGNTKLVEGNTWGDTFWGVCRGRGANTLGKLLMVRRAELRASCTPQPADPSAPTT